MHTLASYFSFYFKTKAAQFHVLLFLYRLLFFFFNASMSNDNVDGKACKAIFLYSKIQLFNKKIVARPKNIRAERISVVADVRIEEETAGSDLKR